MNVKDAVRERRSIRKFRPHAISHEELNELVRLGRLYASGMNAQPISFAVISKKENRSVVFSALNWAMRLKDFTIEENQQPGAYILLLRDKNVAPFFEFDAGACATGIMLMAEEMGLSSCCLKIARPETISKSLDLKGHTPVYAIALGKAAVKSSIVDQNDSPGYYLDENGDFHVPKKTVEEILIWDDSRPEKERGQ